MGMIKSISSGNILRVVCIAGLILSTCISIPLLIVSIIHAKESFRQEQAAVTRSSSEAGGLLESLDEFDRVLAQNRLSPPINRLDFILNTAEKNALSVDAHVSILKRRRILAKEIPAYVPQYQNAVYRNLAMFPYSENISIIAGEALLLQKNQLDDNDKKDLSNYIKNISVRNSVILLGFYLFEGSARTLTTAKQIPRAAEIFMSGIDRIDKNEQPGLITSAAILQILADRKDAAVNLINRYRTTLLEQPVSAWFLVEASYDFNNPMTAASVLGIEDYPYVNSQSIIRLADALYRADNTNDARFFWNLLTFPEDDQEAVPYSILEKALYNLAGTSGANDERQAYLEKLLAISPDNLSGIIMYSRLLNHESAVRLLHQTFAKQADPFIELELIKQNRGYSEPGKTVADTWLLLGRYPANPEIYQWASYFFQEMRMFDEADYLKKNAEYNNIDAPWLTLQKALDAMRAGDLDYAEELLKSVSPESGWEIPANLGLIKKSQLALTEAIEYFESASSLCGNNKDQALIQLNIALCFRALGNVQEARRVLYYAQDLDPNNLQIRLELRKLRNL